jgi:putative transposase
MKKTKSPDCGRRFAGSVINCAVRWCFRFNLSLRDIEERLLERDVCVTCETVRRWCYKCAAAFLRDVQKRHGARPVRRGTLTRCS